MHFCIVNELRRMVFQLLPQLKRNWLTNNEWGKIQGGYISEREPLVFLCAYRARGLPRGIA